MFTDTQSAIIYAYRKLGKKRIAQSPIRPPRMEHERSIEDGQFVAMVILGQIGQTSLRHFLDARYSRDNARARRIVREWLFNRVHRDRWFLEDILRRWGGNKPLHDFRWWSKHLCRNYSTIFRWKHKATDQLDRQLLLAEAEIDSRLRAIGIISDF